MLQNEWNSEFNIIPESKSCKDNEEKSTNFTSDEVFTENVVVPQGDREDLFDKAVVALNANYVCL